MLDILWDLTGLDPDKRRANTRAKSVVPPTSDKRRVKSRARSVIR